MKHSVPQIPTPLSMAKQAFTLIELLIVIAIVGVLIALAFPAVAKARAKSQSIKCTANLKNLGLGLNLYVTDNNRYPGAIPSPGEFWIQIADSYALSKTITGLYDLSPSTKCPSRAPNTGEFGIGYGYNFAGFGYTATSVGAADLPVDQLPIKYWHFPPARMQNPSKVILLGDGLDSPPAGTYTEMFLYLNNFTVSPSRHSGGGNYLFADGHLEWLTPKALEELFVPGKPEPLFPF